MTTTKMTQTTPMNKAGYVTNRNHYKTQIVHGVIWLCVAVMTYFMGVSQGDTECNLETATLEIRNQKEVYDYDNQVDSTLPDVHNTSAWAKWMHDQVPVFASRP